MDSAIQVFSRYGLFEHQVSARDIRSREHFRKCWPMVTPNQPRQLVTWVSPTFENDQCIRRSHFRVLPHVRQPDPRQIFEAEEADRQRLVQESDEHRQAKALIAAELSNRIANQLALPWSFIDPDASDFPLVGNLLLGATDVAQEHPLSTPFGSQYRLDMAVLGPPIEREPMVLGGIEIEFGHAFDGRKAILGKSMGFPLITVDITGMTLADLTPAWAARVLTATTHTTEDGRRQSYLYIHDLLYPLYAQIPAEVAPSRRHQYLVFAADDSLQRLRQWLTRLSQTLQYPPNAVVPALVNARSRQSLVMLERAGAIVGADWRSYNDHQCLRLTLPRPAGPHDLQAHQFHMTLARLLLSHADALVGYMYENGHSNDHPEEALWTERRWDKEQKKFIPYARVLPKRLAEPVRRLMQIVEELQG